MKYVYLSLCRAVVGIEGLNASPQKATEVSESVVPYCLYGRKWAEWADWEADSANRHIASDNRLLGNHINLLGGVDLLK